MRPTAGRLLAWWLAAAAVCVGRASAADGFADPGVCTRCHATQAALATGEGGHAPGLDCLVCHEERRPGSFGQGHRAIPTSCTSHHATSMETHPEPGRTLRPARLQRRCLTCHDVHGSSNAHLVRTAIRVGRRFHPIDFHDAGGAVAGGFVDPVMPGRGLCERCHRDTSVYRADGRGAPHFTEDCTLCHDHGEGFLPVVTDAGCTVCHADQAARLAKTSLHHAEFSGRCSTCHAEARPEPGPGHRATSACADCHAEARVATHVPVGTAIPCTQCHEPHGSDNARLVREVVHTSQGADQPVRFTGPDARVDGGFASASGPGTGLCEVCHTRTQFYRADGGGAAHYTEACALCHPHERGFAPR
jgi:predicted CXXCH cytochrome family protein